MRAEASLISRTRPLPSSTVTMSGQARMTVSSRRWRSARAAWTRVHSVMSVAMAAIPVTAPAESSSGNRVVIMMWGPSASVDDVVAGEGLAVVEHAPVGVVDGGVGPDLADGLAQDVLALEPEGTEEHLVDHHVPPRRGPSRRSPRSSGRGWPAATPRWRPGRLWATWWCGDVAGRSVDEPGLAPTCGPSTRATANCRPCTGTATRPRRVRRRPEGWSNRASASTQVVGMDEVDQRHPRQLVLVVAEEGGGGAVAPDETLLQVEHAEDLVRHLEEHGQVVVGQLPRAGARAPRPRRPLAVPSRATRTRCCPGVALSLNPRRPRRRAGPDAPATQVGIGATAGFC